MTFGLWHIVLAASIFFMIGFFIGAWWAAIEPALGGGQSADETYGRTAAHLMDGKI